MLYLWQPFTLSCLDHLNAKEVAQLTQIFHLKFLFKKTLHMVNIYITVTHNNEVIYTYMVMTTIPTVNDQHVPYKTKADKILYYHVMPCSWCVKPISPSHSPFASGTDAETHLTTLSHCSPPYVGKQATIIRDCKGLGLWQCARMKPTHTQT